jgi:aldehyde dehydrogenase (NAD+)
MEENLELLATVETLNNGKAFSMARVDVQGSADVFRYYGGWADKILGQTTDINGDRVGYTVNEP